MTNERRPYYLVLAGVLSILFAVAIFIATSKTTQASPSELTSEACRPLIDNGLNRINILLFTDSEQEARKYSDFLLNTEPYNSKKEAFNIYWMDDKPAYSEYKNIAVLGDAKQAKQKAALCPESIDIMALFVKAGNKRSSTYQGLTTNNIYDTFPEVFFHEMGHIFGLGEEYRNNQRFPGKIPNCKDSCSEFGQVPENSDGCFQECTTGDLHRSIDSGLMRTLSSDTYGTFNSNLIILEIERLLSEKEKSLSAITGNQILNSEETCNQEFILSEISLVEGEYLIKSSSYKGCSIPGNGVTGEFKYEIEDSTGEIILSEDVSPLIYTDGNFEESSEELTGETYDSILDGSSILISLPPNSDELNLYDENDQLITTASLYDSGARPCQI